MTTPKEALKTGQKLGQQVIRKTEISWDWDYKRKLLDPDINLWSEYSSSKPWKNIKEILQALNKLQPQNQKWKNNNPKGGPLALTKQQQTTILKLREEGFSLREIAQKLNCSKSSVQRFLKTVP